MNITLTLLLLLTLAGGAQQPNAGTKAPLGEEFRIKIGKEATIKKLRIKFITVNSESRCPTGVQCIWAGNAAIVVEVTRKNKKPMQATLNTNTAAGPNEFKYKGNKIRLIALNPYPKIDQQPNEKDYEAILIVTNE